MLPQPVDGNPPIEAPDNSVHPRHESVMPIAAVEMAAAAQVADDAGPDKPQKKKEKARAAWIAFAGRIVAQLVGAVATVTLGIAAVQQYATRQAAVQPAPPPASSAPTAEARRDPVTDGVIAIAVLPMENYSGDPTQQSFADALTEAVTAELAATSRVRVISRTSAMTYKGQRKPLTEIARELGADFVVEGSVVRSGERLRVTAQLIDAATDGHVWARSYDRTLEDVLSVQSEIAGRITGDLNAALPIPPAHASVGQTGAPLVRPSMGRGPGIRLQARAIRAAR